MGTSLNVKAAACNMAALITWSFGDNPALGALAQGVQITRIAGDGTRTVLPSEMPFPGGSGATQPSSTWPIQKAGRYYDFFPPAGTYQYEVALMLGQPGSLQASATVVATSNLVKVTTQLTDWISACFNWGILSTQYISRWIQENCGADALSAAVSAESAIAEAEDGSNPEAEQDLAKTLGPLVTACTTPGNALREQLSAGLIEFLEGMLKTAAAEGGHIYDISYELTDQEWIDFLTSPENAKVLSIIIADIVGRSGNNENANGLAALQASAAEVFNRQLKNKYGIAHNKAQARTDASGTPQEIASGAANKTVTGFCGQASNAVRIISTALAAQYIAYFNALKDDTLNDNSAQGPALRQWCAKMQDVVTLPDGTTIQAIFAPNGASASKPTSGLTMAMQYIQNIIDGLEEGDVVAANFFIPGHPAVPDFLAQAKIAKPGIVMKVAVSDKSALPDQLPPTADGGEPVFVVAQSLKAPFANLLPEILGLPNAHAYIHSKTLSIYKKATNTWIVITGSHNLGEKADVDNDENLLIITGCTPLGLAYFVDNLSVYDHFLFRQLVNAGQAGTGYLTTDGSWQNLSAVQATELQMIMAALASGETATATASGATPAASNGGTDGPGNTIKSEAAVAVPAAVVPARSNTARGATGTMAKLRRTACRWMRGLCKS